MKQSEVDEKVFKDMFKFFEAQYKAEKNGQHEFKCPLCGGNAIWERATCNNHLHTKCNSCGFVSMQ